HIIRASRENAGQYDVNAIVEEVCRSEILCFGRERRDEVLKALGLMGQNGKLGLWLSSLQQGSAFNKTQGQAKSASTEEQESSVQPSKDIKGNGDPFGEIDWMKYRFIT